MAITVQLSQSNISATLKKKPAVLTNQTGLNAVRELGDLNDIDLTANEDGSVLIYDETTGKFKASRILEKQEMNGGHF